MIYIKIQTKVNSAKKKKPFLIKILSIFIPKANPDYENKIDLVSDWLLEFRSDNSTPNREIGLDNHKKVLVKMPHKENYGYWTDNTMTLNDFKNSFETKKIPQEFFELKWKELH